MLESQGEGTDLQFDGGKNPRRAVKEEGGWVGWGVKKLPEPPLFLC